MAGGSPTPAWAMSAAESGHGPSNSAPSSTTSSNSPARPRPAGVRPSRTAPPASGAALAHVTDVMSKAVQSRIANGTEDAGDGPLAKIFYSEVNLAMTEFGVALQGVGGLAVEGDGRAYADGWWQDAFLYARAFTIAGGANEVLKTVVAERALGLPRDKR